MSSAITLMANPQSRLRSAVFGGLTAWGLCILAIIVIFEYSIALLFLFPLHAAIGILGFLLGWLRIVPPLQYKTTLAVFSLIAMGIVGISGVQNVLLRVQRQTIARSEVPIHPSANLIEEHYRPGDGFTSEPIITKEFQTRMTFKDVVRFFNEKMRVRRWSSRFDQSWNKSGYAMSLHQRSTSEEDTTTYDVNFLFYGSWIDDLRYLRESKDALP